MTMTSSSSALAGQSAPAELVTEIVRKYGTPGVVVDMDKVDANIARLQASCAAAGVSNRPHTKTHKSPALARLQIEAGARGITCQKLGEAEVMADAGITDILVSYNILGEEKVGRLGALQRRARMIVAADNPVTISGLSQAGEIAGRDVEVLVECDTGLKRAGVETASEAVELAKMIAASPGLQFAGFLFYPPRDAWDRMQLFLDTAMRGCVTVASRQTSFRPADPRTFQIWESSKARQNTARAPRSSMTGCN